uniref:RWD domain-containing protein n=1 Tax=Gongylonema pulchrum TaxID=637853 RepID=A0A183EWL8_9BILA
LYIFSSPPYYELSGPSLLESQKLNIKHALNELYGNNIGQPVLYEWIAHVKSYLAECAESSSREPKRPNEGACVVAIPDTALLTTDRLVRLPTIISSNTILDRRSTFQAHVAEVFSKEEVSCLSYLQEQVILALNKLKENNKIARATHNIYAWLTEEFVKGRWIRQHDCDVIFRFFHGGFFFFLFETTFMKF